MDDAYGRFSYVTGPGSTVVEQHGQVHTNYGGRTFVDATVSLTADTPTFRNDRLIAPLKGKGKLVQVVRTKSMNKGKAKEIDPLVPGMNRGPALGRQSLGATVLRESEPAIPHAEIPGRDLERANDSTKAHESIITSRGTRRGPGSDLQGLSSRPLPRSRPAADFGGWRDKPLPRLPRNETTPWIEDLERGVGFEPFEVVFD